MRKAFSFLVGVVLGAIVGAGVAILLAPVAGSELQQRLRLRMGDLIEEGKRAADERRAELQAQLEAFKRGAPVTIDRAE
jgi:gas vesicle protein